jgi:hypothetical protein
MATLPNSALFLFVRIGRLEILVTLISFVQTCLRHQNTVEIQVSLPNGGFAPKAKGTVTRQNVFLFPQPRATATISRYATR